jgi:hypothetical protein
MKNLLIVLSALGTLSAFAKDNSCLQLRIEARHFKAQGLDIQDYLQLSQQDQECIAGDAQSVPDSISSVHVSYCDQLRVEVEHYQAQGLNIENYFQISEEESSCFADSVQE